MENFSQWIFFGIMILGFLAYKLFFGTVKKFKLKKFQDLPQDIQIRIKKTFPNPNDYKEVVELISLVQNDNFSVGNIQLIRSILVIAEKDKKKIKEIIVEKDYYGDSRDVIMEAMGMPGNTNDHGMTPVEN